MATKRRKIVPSEDRCIIAKVYHFLREEYRFTKEFKEPNCDISHLRDIMRRTAEATGVSTKTVQRILEEERRSLAQNIVVSTNEENEQDNKSLALPVQKIKKENVDEDSRSSPDAASHSQETPAPQPPVAVKTEQCAGDDEVSLGQAIRSIAAQLNELQGNDTYDSFGRYMASVLRSVGPARAAALQPRIVELLVQAAGP